MKVHKGRFSLVILFTGFFVQFLEATDYSCGDSSTLTHCIVENVVRTNALEEINLVFYGNRRSLSFKDSTISEMPSNFFSQHPNIKNFIASNCNLSSIAEKTFDSSNLIYVNLSFNQISEIKEFAFAGTVQLQYLDLSKNQIQTVDETAFNNLNHLSLLVLNDNQIESLPSEIFYDLTGLKKIYIAQNKLTSLDDAIFSKCTNLELISLSNNQLQVIEAKLFNKLQKSPVTLSIKNNQLKELMMADFVPSIVHVEGNLLKTVEIGRKMTKIYASNNQIEDIILPEDNLPIYSLILSNNLISNLTTISKLENLKYLDVSFNPIGALPLDIFTNLKKLKDLDLENANISGLNHGIFSQQGKLTRLDISYNNLTNLDLDILASIDKLEELFIDGNNFVDLKLIDMSHFLSKVKKIGLIDNRWNCSFLAKFVQELRKNNVEIDNSKGNSVTNITNVSGIACDKGYQEWQNPKKHEDKLVENEENSEDLDANKSELIDDGENIMGYKKQLTAFQKDIQDMQNRFQRGNVLIGVILTIFSLITVINAFIVLQNLWRNRVTASNDIKMFFDRRGSAQDLVSCAEI